MEPVEGTVRLPDGWVPVAGDELRVTLEDVSRADAPATVLAEHRGVLVGDDVQPFSLPYDASGVDPRARLAVRGQGLRAGSLVLTSTQHTPAPERGSGESVELVLHVVAAQQPSSADGDTDAALLGSWTVQEIEGSAVEPGLRGAPLTLSFHGGVVTGFSGCNTFRASCRTSARQLELGPVAATRRACVTGMEQEHRLLVALEGVTSYERNGPLLVLKADDGRAVVRLAWYPVRSEA